MSEATRSYRISKAVIACLCYATCSTTLTLANKHIFSHDLNYPWTLLSVQSFFVTLILITFQLVRCKRSLSFTLMRQMLLPCLLFTAFIFSNTQALRNVSLPVLSVMKSLAPMGIALAELFLFEDTISRGTGLAMILIVFGNVVTMLNDLEFSAEGYAWAIGNIVFNIAYVVSLRGCLSDNFSPIQKTIHSNLTAAVIMMPLSVASGEVIPFLDEVKETGPAFRVVYMISCVLAAGIGASVFWVVQTSSGSTLSFMGSCNKFVVVVLGALLFKTRISPLGWVSVSLGVLAGVVFAVAKIWDKQEATKKSTFAQKKIWEIEAISCNAGRKKTACDKDAGSDEEEGGRVADGLMR